jgi:hypothetical protein
MSRILAFLTTSALVIGIGGIAACESVSEEQKRDIENQNEGLPPESPSEQGDTSVFDLREGDCIGSVKDGYLETVEKMSCDRAEATNRVTNLFTVSVDGSYPSEAYFDEQYVLYCDINAAYYLWPSEDSWAVGDRTIICLEDL